MAAENKIGILAVDDHPLLRAGIAAVIAGQKDMTLVGEATNGDEAIEAFRLHRPDVTLMDLQMPEKSGIEAMTVILREFPDARIVVLTTFQGDVQAVRAIKAGASGYLLKNMLRKELVETIRTVHGGGRRIAPRVAEGVAGHVASRPLTGREIDILDRVAKGNSNKIIASQLGISEGTVKTHLKSILSKLGANDRTHAVTIAMKRGFIEG